MRVALLCPEYPPSALSGGGVSAVANLIARLGQEVEFFVLTRARDEGGASAARDVWVPLGNAHVYCASPGASLPRRVAQILTALAPDAYLTNSLFSIPLAAAPVALRRLGRIPSRPLLVAPRGSLHPEALRSGWAKKRAFLSVARASRAYDDVAWLASSELEAQHIRHEFPHARVAVAGDIVDLSATAASSLPPRGGKRRGQLSIAYLSRILPIKNLAGGLRMLAGLEGEVRVHVYGPATDARYHAQCVREARRLPPNVHVRFEGVVEPDRVLETLAQHQVFFLPTRGESFGYAIVEGLVSGCVPVISDRTPWRGLQDEGVGWDLPLDDEGAFRGALQACIDMDASELARRSALARQLGLRVAQDSRAVERYRELLGGLVSSARVI
jgi:glycosyltransferase involved in cell wall biosynthesis